MIDWLKKRLSGSQQQSVRYNDLSEALQTFWEENFDDQFNALIDTRSIYTASDRDLAKRLSELGDRFTPDFPSEYDRPLAIAWRLYEIKRKETSFLLENTFKRNFGNLSVEWVNILAHKDKEYGEDFLLEMDVSESGESELYYLTSRGKIRADLGHIHRLGIDKAQFIEVANKLAMKSKPSHIVYDGIIFFLLLPIYMPALTVMFEADKKTVMNISAMHGRYDYIKADDKFLDSGNYSFTGEKTIDIVLNWDEVEPRIDNHVFFDDVPADFCQLDSTAWDMAGF